MCVRKWEDNFSLILQTPISSFPVGRKEAITSYFTLEVAEAERLSEFSTST